MWLHLQVLLLWLWLMNHAWVNISTVMGGIDMNEWVFSVSLVKYHQEYIAHQRTNPIARLTVMYVVQFLYNLTVIVHDSWTVLNKYIYTLTSWNWESPSCYCSQIPISESHNVYAWTVNRAWVNILTVMGERWTWHQW